MSTFIVPVENIAQNFSISLAGKEYLMTCRWNDAIEAGWVIDFSDALTNVPIVANIPLVTGTDLLAGLAYLGFQGELYVHTDGSDTAVPTFLNLGIESFLYFSTDVVSG